MPPTMPSPSEISYFVEAAATRNFSRAAAKLGISQPSLSAAMVRLEDAVGAKLFERSRRGVDLTRSGRQLLEDAQRLLNVWTDVRTAAVAATDKIQGMYTIGVHPSTALYTLGKFLPAVLKEQPYLHVRLRHDLSRKVTEGVVQGEIDLGIAVNPRPHPDLIISPVLQDDVTIWQRTGKQGKQNPWRADNSILICDPELIQSQDILRRLRRKASPTRIIESSNLEVICELTASGVGMGILPARVAQRASRPLARIEGTPVFRDEVCVVIRAEQRKVAAIRYLAGAIAKSLQ